MQKNRIFRDTDIVEFCQTTKDINEIHDPVFMSGIGKRVIVPGMYAFSCAANLSADFLKTKATCIKVFFNSLLSSGDFATLQAVPGEQEMEEVKLAAISHKNTLTSREDYTRICKGIEPFTLQTEGLVHSLEVTATQLISFKHLIEATEDLVSNFLFAVSYASQALYKSIEQPQTEVEHEIHLLISKGSKISPFYHTLQIHIPPVFPSIKPGLKLDYRIQFIREKKNRAYHAFLQCEQEGQVVYNSKYNLVAISDVVILRMAKEIHLTRQDKTFSPSR